MKTNTNYLLLGLAALLMGVAVFGAQAQTVAAAPAAAGLDERVQQAKSDVIKLNQIGRAHV